MVSSTTPVGGQPVHGLRASSRLAASMPSRTVDASQSESRSKVTLEPRAREADPGRSATPGRCDGAVVLADVNCCWVQEYGAQHQTTPRAATPEHPAVRGSGGRAGVRAARGRRGRSRSRGESGISARTGSSSVSGRWRGTGPSRWEVRLASGRRAPTNIGCWWSGVGVLDDVDHDAGDAVVVRPRGWRAPPRRRRSRASPSRGCRPAGRRRARSRRRCRTAGGRRLASISNRSASMSCTCRWPSGSGCGGGGSGLSW